jgi:ribose-phosphate pyrophosphokinase
MRGITLAACGRGTKEPDLKLSLLGGPAHPLLAKAMADHLGIALAPCELQRFPDGEMHVQVEASVRGHDVYIVQPTNAPVEEHLFGLLLMADACRRAGAARLTAVVPYFGYARQDRRASGREPVGARLAADLMRTGGLQRLVAVDLHSSSLEGVFGVPLEHLTAVPMLAAAARSLIEAHSVVVAPDLGAAKLADRYGQLLGLPVAVVHKVRLSGEDVTVRAVTGRVEGRRPVIVDDMISTAGTVEAALKAVLAEGARPEPLVLATHGLFVGPASRRLPCLGARRIVTTDSVPARPQAGAPVDVVGLGSLLGTAIGRLHHDESLADLLVHA